MIKKDEFRKLYEHLVNVVWTLQHRILELEEFERQWRVLFELLEGKAGREVQIHVRNWEAYRAFRWDLYHVLTSDVLSAVENELQNENSVVRQTLHHLEIHPSVQIRFYEDGSKDEHYWLARKRFYESDRVLSVVVKAPENDRTV